MHFVYLLPPWSSWVAAVWGVGAPHSTRSTAQKLQAWEMGGSARAKEAAGENAVHRLQSAPDVGQQTWDGSSAFDQMFSQLPLIMRREWSLSCTKQSVNPSRQFTSAINVMCGMIQLFMALETPQYGGLCWSSGRLKAELPDAAKQENGTGWSHFRGGHCSFPKLKQKSSQQAWINKTLEASLKSVWLESKNLSAGRRSRAAGAVAQEIRWFFFCIHVEFEGRCKKF